MLNTYAVAVAIHNEGKGARGQTGRILEVQTYFRILSSHMGLHILFVEMA